MKGEAVVMFDMENRVEGTFIVSWNTECWKNK